MQLSSFEEKIHSLVIVLLVGLLASFVFLTSDYRCYLAIYLFCISVIYYCNSSLVKILKVILLSFAFSFFCAYFIVFFPNEKYFNSELIDCFFIRVPKKLVLNQFKIFMQVGIVSSFSYLSMGVINFEKLLVFSMKKKWMGAYLGYPILLALNSIVLLRSEFEKIRINSKMRGVRYYYRINMLFPLLVFAIRHADRGALSLVTRGLNENKLYYFNVELSRLDKAILLVSAIIVFVCIYFKTSLF